jgi:ABC-2 type transport system permease protein
MKPISIAQKALSIARKTISIARKSLLELWREPLLLGLLLFFPMALVGFYYFAFGQTEGGLATYLTVLVMNEDAGTAMPGGGHWQAGADLVDAIRDTEWDGDPVFDVQVATDLPVAEIALRERKASLLLAIPPSFSQLLIDGASGTDGSSPAVVTLVGDPGSDGFVFAHSFLQGLVREFAKQVAGWQDDTVTIAYEFLPGTGTVSDFDWGVAGIIVFGVMFIVITTATVLVRENVTGTLRRLRLTRAGAAAVLLGVTLAQMLVALVQVPITFGSAVVMGFQGSGSLLLAMGITLMLTLSAVGLGLVVACFARSDGEAANLGSGVLVLVVFISGALYPMPDLPLFTIAGRTIQVYDFLPPTHASEALRQVLIYGEGPEAVAYELVAMTLLSLVSLAVGIVLYQRLQMQRGRVGRAADVAYWAVANSSRSAVMKLANDGVNQGDCTRCQT